MKDYVPPTDLICQLQPDTLHRDNSNNEADEELPSNVITGTPGIVLPHLYVSKHIYYVMRLVSDLSQPSSYEGAVTEHLRMSGIYWSLTTLHILLPSVRHVNDIMNVDTSIQSSINHDETTATDRKTNMETATSTVAAAVAETEETSSAVTSSSGSNDGTTSTETSSSILDWIWTCYDATTGSFGGNTGQDGHILYTLSALQIIIVTTTTIASTSSTVQEEVVVEDDHDDESRQPQPQSQPQTKDMRLQENRDTIVKFIQQLQQPDGSFVGDTSDCGEIDTRFTYCAFQSLVLLNAFHNDIINIPLAVQYVLQCRNLSDGGFGSCIGAESHAGQVFCCIGALAIAQALDQLYPPSRPTNQISTVDNASDALDGEDDEPPDDVLGWWLCERQVDSGGLNGRPEKQADVCYSWWILSSLSILGKVSWINTNKLANYILKCQDTVDGGIADRPDDMADVFHTFFGIAGLSLLGHLHRADQVTLPESTSTTGTNANRIPFRSIDPIYALPTDICQQLQLPGQVMVARTVSNDATGSSTPIIDARLQYYNVYYYD